MRFQAIVAAMVLFAADVPTTGSSAAITDLEYQLTFDRSTAAAGFIDVGMTFTVPAPGPVELSLPAWTPGAYELSNFARKVGAFTAAQNGAAIGWDKVDFDTWRVRVPAAGKVEVGFQFTADSLDNAMAWSRPDFVFVNGTNVFLYPEGSDLSFPASVTIKTEPDWKVATGMNRTGARYDAPNFHDLVDMPIFIGRFDLDSARVENTWHRLASYPAGALAGMGRRLLWSHITAMVPPMTKVFGDTPWSHYSTLLVFDSSYGGGSALEHQNSHVGIYHPGFIGTAMLASITAHEIFHAWNVKRLRPAEMVPYRYDRAQPTPLLWVSEGITDYYADLALVRGGIIDSTVFLDVTTGKIDEVAQVPAVALEDASLSTWIQPIDGTATIYYPKGSLAGLLLDILIRDASDNRASLDDVLRALYLEKAKAGKGFTTEEWWATVDRIAGKPIAAEFAGPYIDGREPFPWGRVGPFAGIRFVVDSIREPQLGIGAVSTETETIVTRVEPGSAAAAAGILPGDVLVSVGDVTVDAGFGAAFRQRYLTRAGERIPVVVSRDGTRETLTLTVRMDVRTEQRLEYDRRASLKAARIRHGILKGITDRS